MKNLQGRVAVVTGAASGIGRALARGLFAEGCHLALSDIDSEGLAALGQELSAPNRRVSLHALDVADRAAVHAYAELVMREHGGVDLVINNAGVTVIDSAETTSYEDFDWVMGINFWGVVHGSRAFLPYLKLAPEGCLVNISSIFGLVGFPGQAAYNASKFAVRGFTESLNQELRLTGQKLRAISVHPGGIDTNIARAARFTSSVKWIGKQDEVIKRFSSQLARTSPEQAAARIIKGIKGKEFRILIGADAYATDLLQRLLPRGYQGVANYLHRKLASRGSAHQAPPLPSPGETQA